MKRVLVTGATGYLGRFVVQELKSRGYFVRVLARSPEKAAGLKVYCDEITIGQITQPETLAGICENIDVVFSSVGVTKQRDNLTFREVDYQANKNILDIAKRTAVSKFIYVSVFNGPQLLHLEMVKAHEDFVIELKASGMDYAILRPTGYFSDMEEIYRMAHKGRVFLIGHGRNRINPIHGADLAVSCVDAIEKNRREIDLGGPETLTWREIAELAFEAQNKPPKIVTVPVWILSLVILLTRCFNRHTAELLSFFKNVATQEIVGPANGFHKLKEHFRNIGVQS